MNAWNNQSSFSFKCSHITIYNLNFRFQEWSIQLQCFQSVSNLSISGPLEICHFLILSQLLKSTKGQAEKSKVRIIWNYRTTLTPMSPWQNLVISVKPGITICRGYCMITEARNLSEYFSKKSIPFPPILLLFSCPCLHHSLWLQWILYTVLLQYYQESFSPCHSSCLIRG